MKNDLSQEINIFKVKKDDENEVIELLSRCFVGKEKEKIRQSYEYIHYGNPEQNYCPIGLIASHNNKIIGYRGFIGLPYKIGSRKIKILVSCDTATHPDYRRMGVSSTINEKSINVFSDEYLMFLNISLNKLSVLGKFKQNWSSLGEKDYLYKKQIRPIKCYKRGIDIVFSEVVPSDSIFNIQKESIFSNNSIRIDLSSIRFIDWIFGREGYQWAVSNRDGKSMSYCCFTIDDSNCNLIHFDSTNNDGSLAYLLNEIVKKYSVKSFYCFIKKRASLRKSILKNYGFYSTNIPIFRRLLDKELLPILIRPTIREFNSTYFEYGDLDLSDIDNWDITMLSYF